MARPLPFRDLKRKLRYYGIVLASGGRGSHWKVSRTLKGVKIVYTFAVHKGCVDQVYVSGLRKRFGLTPDEGISDQDFEEV